MNAETPCKALEAFNRIQSDIPVSAIRMEIPRASDDHNNAHHVCGAVDKRLHRFSLGKTANHGDNESQDEEPARSLNEVPFTKRKAGDNGRPTEEDFNTEVFPKE